jgi:hypothetical protein
MNNVYSQREKKFMSDYETLLMGASAGQSPTAVSNKYPNISENRKKYLKNIVQSKFK